MNKKIIMKEEPEKIHDIQEVSVLHLPKIHSEDYWYENNDSAIRNYITGRDVAAISGIGRFGLNRARNEYMSLGNTFRRKSLSAPQMAKYENKYHIDQSLFDVARDEVEADWQADYEKYQFGKMSDRRWDRKSQRYEQQMKNLDENQYILDQQQNPLKYITVHRDEDIAPALFALGLPAAIIGGISGGFTAAPYLGKALANPWVQRGLTGLDVVDTGAQIASGNYLGAAANWIPYDKVQKFFKHMKYIPHTAKEKVKNLYNRYTAPRTTIKHTPYKGDQHQLAKFRLVNGGFDKLGIHAEDAMFLPKEHPMVTAGYGYDDAKWANDTPVNARTFLLKSQPVPLREKYNVIAWYDPSDKMYYQPSYGKYSKLDMDTKAITAHEYQHAVDDVRTHKNRNLAWRSESPRVTPPGTDMSKVPWYVQDYFQADDGTELHARLAQLKNWYGIRDPHQPITPEMWNYARRHYVPSMGGFDNNMQQMFRVVTDPKKFLDWINPRVASQAGVVGTAGLSLINNENDE